MSKSKMNFEQVPVEVIKQIAKEFSESSSAENNRASAQTLDASASSSEDWRVVAQQVQQEQDPGKMVELVQQLITTFDEEQARKYPASSVRQLRNQPGASKT